jgi:non-heme chloroperoxidase
MATIFGAMPAGRRHRVTCPDGIEIEVREWGDPAGPPVILVPGVAQSLLSFARQATDPVLARFRLVAYDPRGHGLSDKPDGIRWYSGPCWSAEVAAVITALKIERPVLAGWSLGGRIVRQYLMDHGDGALAGLAFLSCRPVEEPEVVGSGNDVANDLVIEDLASRIDVATRFLRNCFAGAPEPEDFAAMLAYNMLCPWEIRRQIGAWLTDVSVSSAALTRVQVPTLIVHGTADVLVLPAAANTTARLIPHAQLSMHQRCGHSVFWEDAAAFNRLLGDFVASVAWPGASKANRPGR